MGRTTRVWCAYKQVKSNGTGIPEEHRKKIEDEERKNGDVFVGPYALKFQHVDMSTQAFRQKIVKELTEKAREDPDGAEYVLLPER